MRTREGLLRGGESGKPGIVPREPEHSPMFLAVLRQGKLKMPPKEKNQLTSAETEILRQWIASGAVWAESKTPKPKWELKPEDIWAFQPLSNPTIPATVRSNYAIKTPIDAFVAGKLAEKSLDAAPAADRVTLIRRATYDLLGLPPTPQDIEAFAKDRSPDAFDRLIERLLASPRYGEQWGRHWLDVVRYADTDGYSNDYERPNAWRYRDYVIRSFNADKPYNQFILEQIAGDELDPSKPENLIAVGMLRSGPWEHTAMSVAAVTRQLFLDDVTHNVGATYLGLTVGCARCHDHKFDPIPTKDYYSLQSVYAPVQFENRKVAFLPVENTQDFEKEIARVNDTLKALQKRLREMIGKHDRAVNAWLKEKGFAALKDVPFGQRPLKEFGLTPTESSTEKVLRKRVDYCQRELERYQPKAFSVSSGGMEKPVPTPVLNVLVGGSIESPGESVRPGILNAVLKRGHIDYAASEKQIIPETDSGRRLALARWVASSENPLTARVIVNRVWQWHFGEGLVATPNNFGKMGKKPTYPELLDWLARYLIDHNWSLKDLHRVIMRSAAYQQGAVHPDLERVKKVDSEEKLLSHFPARRLTGEELRDSMLFAAGELSNTLGGPPVFPEINMEAALQPRHIMGSLAPPYKPSRTREQRNRRTIYTAQIRTLINPMLQVFNEPSTDLSCERRDSTTVTPQAFTLLNSQFANDCALAMAARLSKSHSKPAEQVAEAFRLAYGRLPTSQEKTLSLKHLDEMAKRQRVSTPAKFELPKSVVQPMIEEITGEPFDFEEEWDISGYEYNLRAAEVTPEVRALADLCLVLLNSNEFVYVY